jgi:peptide/nickel transport system substrate-binding protein
MTHSARTCLLAALATLSLACRGDAERSRSTEGGAAPGGTIVITTGADADILLPPLVYTIQGNQVVDLVFERLAEVGLGLNTYGDRGFTPELARRWTWGSDSLSIAFELDPRARWHDGRPVTARDVAFTFATYSDPEVGANEQALLTRIDSVTARDSLTAVFWFGERYSEQFFDAVNHMRIIPAHVFAGVKPAELRTAPGARAPVGSGQYRFVRWDAKQVIELAADTAHYRGRPNIDRIVWLVSPDYDASFVRLLSGDADFIEYVRPARMKDLVAAPELTATRYPSLDEGYLLFNLRAQGERGRPHPLFADRALRRALAMGVDRARLVRSVFDTMAVLSLGPVTRAQATWDSTIAQIPFDPDAARRALDSLGWRDADGDGVRERGGRPLRFSIMVPTSSAVRVQLGTLLQDQLRQLGARVDLEQLEINEWVQRQGTGRFDASIGAVRHDASPSSIRQSWSTESARAPESSNYSGYASAAFDALVDSAIAAPTVEAARPYYERAYEMIVQDAPAIWLYETVNYLGHHRRIRPAGMRPDAWWASIARWQIPEGERLPRDRPRSVASAR